MKFLTILQTNWCHQHFRWKPVYRN